MKKTIYVHRPKIVPMNLRYLCYQTDIFPDNVSTKSGIILDSKAILAKDNTLARRAKDSYVVICVAEDNKAEVLTSTGLRKVQPGDIVVPVTQIEYERQDDGTHKKVDVHVYPYYRDEFEAFNFIDQYEVVAIIPDMVDVRFIEEEGEIPDEGIVSLHGTGPNEVADVPFPAEN
jgi:hypothetical protein